jgi:hypothetical protein
MVNSFRSKSFLEGFDVYAVEGAVRRRPVTESWLTLFDGQKLNGHRPMMTRITAKQKRLARKNFLWLLICSLIGRSPKWAGALIVIDY